MWLSEEAAKAISAFFQEGASRNTARSYKTALQYWAAWHVLRFDTPIAPPVSPATVTQFILDHMEHQPGAPAPETTPYTPRLKTTQHLLPLAIDSLLVERGYKAKLGPWSMATVQSRLAALSKAHENFIANNRHLNLGPDANPLRDPHVRQLSVLRGPPTPDAVDSRLGPWPRRTACSRPYWPPAGTISSVSATAPCSSSAGPAEAAGDRRSSRRHSRMSGELRTGLSIISGARKPTEVVACARRI